MKSIDKKVVSPTKSFWRACPPVRRVCPESTSPLHTFTRTLLSAADCFADRLKAVTAEYLQSAIILLVSAVIVLCGTVFISKADFLKDDNFLNFKPQTAKISLSAGTSQTSPSGLLASSGTGSTAVYTYDEKGERATKTENGKTTYYVNKYYEEDSDGTTRKFIWANGVKVATVEGKKGSSAPEKVTYHHPDSLGGSNVSTDPSGTVAEVNDYFPYGKSRLEERTGTYTNNYLYTGKELDRSSGLYYYGARYYDPLTGRFTSIDPWNGDITNPQSLNSYSYVTNNPLKYTDPTGMWGVSYATGSKAHHLLTKTALGMTNVNAIWIKEHKFKLIWGASYHADITKGIFGNKDNSHHSMSSSDISSASELKEKMLGHAKTFFNSSNDLEFGRLLHMVQDSYCPSHVERNKDGKIKAFYDPDKQNTLKHISGDNIKNADLNSLTGAIEATKKLIEFRANSETKWDDVKNYLDTTAWQLTDDATVGTAGEEYKKDKDNNQNN